ncbi:MAG: response regulator [Candidatus Riflebacteria bacterium]|nr:response regulator [Candidatus Riflebacteria bacterium]
MTLIRQTVIIVCATIIFFVSLLCIASYRLFSDSFHNLYESDMQHNLVQVVSIIEENIDKINRDNVSLSSFGDSSDFMATQSHKFIETNFTSSEFILKRLNLIAYIDVQGNLVHGVAMDLKNGASTALPASLNSLLGSPSRLLDAASAKDGCSGFMRLSEGLMMIGAHPVLTGKNAETSRGSLLTGRFFDDSEIRKICEIAHFPFSIVRFDTSAKTLSDKYAMDCLASSSSVEIVQSEGESTFVYRVVKDIFGTPIFLLKAAGNTVIHDRETQAFAAFFRLVLASGIWLCLFMLWFLDRHVLSKISLVMNAIHDIGATGNTARRIHLRGTSEISEVSSALNSMLDKIDHERVRSDEFSHRLQDSEVRFSTFLENVPEAVFIFNADTKQIFMVNQYMVKWLGFTRERLLSMHYFELFEMSTNEALIHDFVELVHNHGTARQTGRRFRKSDGIVVEIEETGIRIVFDNKECVLAIVHDVTAHRNAERDLVQQAEELRFARDEALKANKAKSVFLANMSHELRTPLNAVMGMTSLLLDTKLSPEQRDYLKTIHTSGDMLLHAFNDVLDFSQLESNSLSLVSIDFNPRTTIEEAIELVAWDASDKGLEIGLLAQAGLPERVSGDPARIRQVMLHLLTNAVKFTQKGEVLVGLRLVRTTEATAVIRFEVSDTGIGIPLSDQARIFEPFIQADSSSSRKFGGSGLGLSICKRLIAVMGGEMGMESREHSGSFFWFSLELPLRMAMENDKIAPTDNKLLGKSIIAVEGNPTGRLILSRQLETLGLKVEMAEDGAAVLQILHEAAASGRRFDMALIDFHTQGMSGMELAHSIKQSPVWSGLPLILASSHSQRGEASQARSAGFSAYLTKPFKQSLLRDCLLEILRPTRSDELVTRHSIAEKVSKQRLRVLVVEDEILNRKATVKVLERLGLRVDVASNGHEALAVLDRCTYDVIIMDCQMPVMDGFETTRNIRRKETADNRIPIIALTEHTEEEIRRQCMESGMDDFLSKPADPIMLAHVLKKRVEGFLPHVSMPSSQTPGKPGSDELANVQTKIDELFSALDEEGTREIWNLFLEAVPHYLNDIRNAIEKRNAKELKMAAYGLKGACGNINALDLFNLCRNIEECALSEDYKRAVELKSRIEQNFDALWQAEADGSLNLTGRSLKKERK